MRTLFTCYTFGLFFLCQAHFGHSQPPTDSANPNEATFIDREKVPEFPGGSIALTKYLQRNTRYPEPAFRAGITGKVFVLFTIDTTGYISDVTILKGLGYACDEEALRVVRHMPAPWQPGKNDGRVCRVKYMLPVPFGPNP